MKTLSALVAALLIAGCVSTGREVSQDQLADFKRGETTIDQVIAKLGQPTNSNLSMGGARSISYVFTHAQARPASFIPFIGPLVGGSDARSTAVTFFFDEGGRLTDYRSSNSQYGMGTGAAAGSYQPQTPGQPQEAPAK